MTCKSNPSAAGVGLPGGNFRWTICVHCVFSIVVRRFVAEAPEKHPQLSAAELACSKPGQPAVDEKLGGTPWLDLLRYRAGWAGAGADFSGMYLLSLRAIQLSVPRWAPGRRNRTCPCPAAAPFLFLS